MRWYGLGYLAGFLVAGWLLGRLSKDGFISLTRVQVSDLIGWLVVGVMVGGRLGYAAFYEPRLWVHPLELLRIWQGGLSFHGGLLGVVITSIIFARRAKVPWLRLADAMVLVAPFGIFFVRCTNFINGELFGRIAPDWLPWAMRFPTDPVARAMSPELARAGSLGWHDVYQQLRASGVWQQQIAPHVPLRHPSQLYEALLEGAAIAAILWTVYRRKGSSLRPGTIGALFLLLYAAARFTVEFVRQPDAQLGFVVGPFSMGQLLSLGVIVGAALLLRRSRQDSNGRSNDPS